MDAAHLLDVAGAEEPSFFELTAQQSMSSVLGPALKYLCTASAQWYPHYMSWILGNSDEVVTFIEFLIQRHYLRNSGGSLAENFYGMKRVPLDIDVRGNENVHVNSQIGNSDGDHSGMRLILFQTIF